MASGAAAVAAPGVARNRVPGGCVGMIPAVPPELDPLPRRGRGHGPRGKRPWLPRGVGGWSPPAGPRFCGSPWS